MSNVETLLYYSENIPIKCNSSTCVFLQITFNSYESKAKCNAFDVDIVPGCPCIGNRERFLKRAFEMI